MDSTMLGKNFYRGLLHHSEPVFRRQRQNLSYYSFSDILITFYTQKVMQEIIPYSFFNKFHF